MPGYNDGKLYLPFEPDPDEEKKCVVFVHGVNMSLDEIRAYTAAFYKRLWWEGYKGRLAVFCWPTKLNTGPGPDILYTDIFNTSEFRAWTAGSALKKFVESLKDILGNDGVIGIAAHSLGNACAGSALRQGLVIDNYVMLEAALSTSCLYGPAMPGEPDLLAGHFHKSLANADGSDINKPSPYDCNDLGYRGYLMDLKNGVKNRITNYHNDEDFWLATGSLRHEFPSLDRVQVDWVCNQAKYKPNGEKSYSFYPVHEPTQGGAVYGRPVVSAHESMSFISKSRTRPLGSEPPSSAGGIPVPPFDPRYCFSVDLKNTYNFTDARSNHSGQFLMEIYQLYYNPKISAPFRRRKVINFTNTVI